MCFGFSMKRQARQEQELRHDIRHNLMVVESPRGKTYHVPRVAIIPESLLFHLTKEELANDPAGNLLNTHFSSISHDFRVKTWEAIELRYKHWCEGSLRDRPMGGGFAVHKTLWKEHDICRWLAANERFRQPYDRDFPEEFAWFEYHCGTRARKPSSPLMED